MKNIIILLLFSNFVISQNLKENFSIDGQIEGSYNGYLYMNYNGKRDSCFVENNKFHFKGNISSDIVYACKFSTGRTSAMDSDLFIENKTIKVVIKIEPKKYNQTEYDWIILKSVTGTKTSLIALRYNEFKDKNKNKKNWKTLNYKNIDRIITENPKNQYSAELLNNIATDSLANIEEIRMMYTKLDSTVHDPIILRNIKEIIYPQKKILLGKLMPHFKLLNEKNETISLDNYQGDFLLIDFWASWCGPCIKQIPKLSDLQNKYSNINFKILSISIDTDNKKWLNAIMREEMKWDNVIDIDNEYSKKLNIKSIPKTFLINPNGEIIGIDMNDEEIEKILGEIEKK